jgi:hypothetical protein
VICVYIHSFLHYSFFRQLFKPPQSDGILNPKEKIIRRTLKTRPQMIAMLNTFTREGMEMVMDHIEYIIKETVTNITGELSNDNKDAGKNGR